MAEWVYDVLTERWNGHGHTYNPVTGAMKLGPNVVGIAEVPQNVVHDLEHVARADIDQILHQVPVLQVTVPIAPINKTFDQTSDNVVNSNVTTDGSFGSLGAGPRLIVFAVAKLQINNHI